MCHCYIAPGWLVVPGRIQDGQLRTVGKLFPIMAFFRYDNSPLSLRGLGQTRNLNMCRSCLSVLLGGVHK